jgi:predicted HTH domain antitoxin
MQITLELPEDIAKHLENTWRDLSRGILEAVAVEAYREEALTRDQVGRLLGLSFWETEAFLKERQAYLAYTEGDLEQDRRDLDRLAHEARRQSLLVNHRRSEKETLDFTEQTADTQDWEYQDWE